MVEALIIWGRVVLGGYFLWSAYGHIRNFEAMVGYAAYKGVPYARFLVALTGVLLTATGLAVFGILPGLVGAIAAALFFIPVTYRMHDFWNIDVSSGDAAMSSLRQGETVNFTKNVAILAGLLIILLS